MPKRKRYPRTSLRNSWGHMMSRCYDEKNKQYRHYGGRGIKVCERWHTFENFYQDMHPRPLGMTLDRRDNDGEYSPDNCRWATVDTQIRNRRYTINLTHNGETMCIADWAARLGMGYNCLQTRIKMGWPVELALTTPPNRKNSGMRVRVGNGLQRPLKIDPNWPKACKHGHEFTPENSYPAPSGRPTCKTCTRLRQRELWHTDPKYRARQIERRREQRQQSRDTGD